MKHLFNDISKDEKNRILEMHKTATDKHYLIENLNINDIMNNVDCAMEKKEQYEPTLRAAWERCKRQHKYVRLSKLPQAVFMHLLITMLMVLSGALVGGRAGLAIGVIFTLLGNMKVFGLISAEIAKGGPESETLKQEIGWLYECLRYDWAVIKLLGEEDLYCPD